MNNTNEFANQGEPANEDFIYRCPTCHALVDTRDLAQLFFHQIIDHHLIVPTDDEATETTHIKRDRKPGSGVDG
jgi:hypothetical protein